MVAVVTVEKITNTVYNLHLNKAIISYPNIEKSAQCRPIFFKTFKMNIFLK